MDKTRQMNYELLRIVAMLMIVCLHYLSGGGALADPAGELTATGYVAWFMESFCIVAVNVYVLISGYFGSQSVGFDVHKPLRIYGQVWFYSVTLGIIALLFGLKEFDIYWGMGVVFPVVTERYWFATAYLLLCLLMPFLNEGVRVLERRQFQWILLGMLLVFCIAKSVLPMQLPGDKYGYDVLWFLVLYLTGAYLRKYKITGGTKWLLLYAGSALLIFASMLAIRSIYLRTGMLEAFISYGYSYNFIFTYTGAIGLFLGFAKIGAHISEHIGPIVGKMASATFGVYLIHVNPELHGVWQRWCGCEQAAQESLGIFLLHLLVTVAAVYVVCTVLELLRKTVIGFLFSGGKRGLS